MNIYVGNLSKEVTEDDLRSAFEAMGQVESVNIIKDKYSGESRGFGFVVMPSQKEAEAAVEELNEKELGGQNINVSEARPRTENRRGSGGNRRGGGGSSRRGGFGGSRGSSRGSGRGGSRGGGSSGNRGGSRRY